MEEKMRLKKERDIIENIPTVDRIFIQHRRQLFTHIQNTLHIKITINY